MAIRKDGDNFEDYTDFINEQFDEGFIKKLSISLLEKYGYEIPCLEIMADVLHEVAMEE